MKSRQDGLCLVCLKRKACADVRRRDGTWWIGVGGKFCEPCVEYVVIMRQEAHGVAESRRVVIE